MAVYVPISREQETDGGFVYRYEASDGSIGWLEISKLDGSARMVALASGDADGRAYALAARKLWKHFEVGEFPQATCWAS